MTPTKANETKVIDLTKQNEILRNALNNAHLEIQRLRRLNQTFEVMYEQIRKEAYNNGRNDNSNNI